MEYKPTEQKHISSEKVAMTCSFLAFISTFFCTVFLPYIFAPLAILFAFFSKGRRKGYSLNAKIAIWGSIGIMILNTAISGFAIYNVMFNEEYRQTFDETYEMLWGASPEEVFNEAYPGISFPSAK